MSRLWFAALTACALSCLSLAPSGARADVIADDDCRAWEHWEGGHEGGCRFGARCAAHAPGSGAREAPLALAVVGLAALALRARRRQR